MNTHTFSFESLCRTVGLAALLAILGACGGGGSNGGGGDTTPPPPPADVTKTISVEFAAGDVVAGSAEPGTASATLEHNETKGEFEISVSLTGLTADAVSLRRAYAGSTGDEVVPLVQGASASDWSLATQSISAGDAADLDAGKLYLLVTTAASPAGALRGQVLPDGVSVQRFDLSADQMTSASESDGSAIAWLTTNENAGIFHLHVETELLDDATSAGFGTALAGLVSTPLTSMVPDAMSVAHWMLEDQAFTAQLQSAVSAGEFYVQLATPAQPDGAVRGQLVAAGQEIVTTELEAGDVVLKGSYSKVVTASGRVMTTLTESTFSAHANLFGIGGVDAIELRQAPAGQNGPVLASFDQDLNDPGLWSVTGMPIDSALAAGLANRTLYVNVTTPGEPDGAARGQIETSASSEPADSSAFLVMSTDPQNASKLEGLPELVIAYLNRDPLASSVTPQAVLVEASGGDGSFGDGNESTLTPASVTANGASVEVDLSGVNADNDVYRVSLVGGGATGIVDTSGIALDGDQDGNPGGMFETAFEVDKPVVVATLTKIQNEIFTPSCATSGCHSGSNPPDGLLLTDGQSWSNTVNVQAVQMDMLRIKPGDPDSSYLVRKIQGSGIVANRMPIGAAKLSQDKIDLIRQWVTEGAQDN